MLKGLRRKIVFINMISVSAILLTVFFAICIITHRTERERTFSMLERQAASVHFDGKPPLTPLPEGDLGIFGEESTGISTITVLFDADGTIKKVYEGREETVLTEIREKTIASALDSGERRGVLRDYSLMFVIREAPNEKRLVLAPYDTVSERTRTTAVISGLVLVLCLVLFFVLSCVLSTLAVKPAEKTWDAQKRFIEDASHDLKTPLTVILTNNEIVSSRISDSETAAWLDATKEEAERMRRMVDGMLELSRSESLKSDVILEDTDISELCERAVLQMEPLAFDSGITLISIIDPGIIVKSHSDTFTRLLQILIDNAIKYSDKGTEIGITLIRDRKSVYLEVKNKGSCISKEDIPHLFERFYRADKARDSSGFGLGLSIAKNLSDSLGAQITAESSPDGITVFSVKI